MTTKPKFPTFDIPFPAGRFVLGSLTELQTKDNNGRDRKNPTLFVAVAIDKRTPGIDQIIGNIIGYTRHTYQYVNGGQQVQQRLAQPNFAAKSGFAWKIKDGDADPKWAAREGCRGCWIFCFGTSYAPARCCDPNNVQMDPKAINLGDYVEVFCTVAVNGEVGDTAGLYLNPNGVRLVGYGQRIIPAGQSFDQMFAGRAAQLPPGASPTPIGGPAPAQFGAPANPPQGYGQQGGGYAPQPGYSPPPQVGGYQPQGAPYSPPAATPDPYAPNAGYGNAAYGAPHSPPNGYGGGNAPAPQPQQYQAPAGGPVAPAGGAYTPAPSAGPQPQPATAYPSSGYNPNGAVAGGQPAPAYPSAPPAGAYPSSHPQQQQYAPAGVTPNYGFVSGPQR